MEGPTEELDSLNSPVEDVVSTADWILVLIIVVLCTLFVGWCVYTSPDNTANTQVFI